MSTFNFGIDPAQRAPSSVSRFTKLELEIMQNLRVSLPGIVQSFDADAQTVDVVIATNEKFLFNVPPQPAPPANSSTIPPMSLQTQALQLALLKSVPFVIANGGGVNLTFPIQAGDECIVLFADTPIGVWWQNGGLNNLPIDQRRHSLSDGIAILGVRSTPRVLSGYSTDSAQLRTDDGDTVIDIKSGKITVTATNVKVEGTTLIDGDTQIGSGADTINLNGSADSMPNAGWGTPIGATLIPSFNATTATTGQCAQMIAEMVTILKALGIFAA